MQNHKELNISQILNYIQSNNNANSSCEAIRKDEFQAVK